MSKLIVRFTGSFLFVHETAVSPHTGSIYFSKADCRDLEPHRALITFDPRFLTNFNIPAALQLTLKGEKRASRMVPAGELTFAINTTSTSLILEQAKAPADIDPPDTIGYKVDLLPRLASGGANSLLKVEELNKRSSVSIRLGSRGHLSTEMVARDSTGKVLQWKYMDSANTEHNKNDRQAIADVLTWTVDLTDNKAAIMSGTSVLVELGASAPTDFEVTISNLGTHVVMPDASNKLHDFACLMDYADSRLGVRLPEPEGVTSTGGSALCPAARWP